MEMERAVLNAAPNLPMRIRKPARVRHHQRFPGLFGLVEHVLRVGQVQRHGNFDLHVLALAQRHHRLIVMLVARGREDDRVHAGTVDALLEVGRRVRDIPLRREFLHAGLGASGNGNDGDVLDLLEGFDVNLAHGPGAGEADLHSWIVG